MPVEVFDGAIGIDLGTTYSCVAVFLHGQVEVVPNDMGNRTTPSCVAFHNNDILVGDAAKSLLCRGVPGVIFDAKRMIGRRASYTAIQKDQSRWPFHISADERDGILIDVEVMGKKTQLAPEQISAQVLTYLKHCAEQYLGKQVKRAIITVPAYFNDAQRERTKAAATVAELEVLRLVNEPTAAALCYGLGIGSGSDGSSGSNSFQNVVVFDFGGGTFDVSVITIDGGSFAVRATAGDTHLGGQDIDSALLQCVLKDLESRYHVDVGDNPRFLAKARTACERVKRVLSHSTSEELTLDGILPDGEEYSFNVSRAKLEELSASVFDRCMDVVKRAMKYAEMTVEEVNEVVLVGGSSRIPKLHALLKQFFKRERLCSSVHPDEAVAVGAAIQASILSMAPEQQSEKTSNVILMDVVPLSIGVEVDGGKFDAIIPRNTTIPYKATKEYSTVEDYQEDVDIYVYEGERPLTKHNHKLGEFTLEGITKAPQGEPTITVTFSVDSNGLLTITGMEELGNKEHTLVVQNEDRLSEEKIVEMIELAKTWSKQDSLELTQERVKVSIEKALSTLTKAVHEMPHPPSEKLLKPLNAFIPRAIAWLNHQLPNYTSTADIEKRAHKILTLARKAMHKVQKETRREGPQLKRHRGERKSEDGGKDGDRIPSTSSASFSDSDDGE